MSMNNLLVESVKIEGVKPLTMKKKEFQKILFAMVGKNQIKKCIN